MKDKLISLFKKLLEETKDSKEVDQNNRFFTIEPIVDNVQQRMKIFSHIENIDMGKLTEDEYSIQYKDLQERISEEEFNSLVDLHKKRTDYFEGIEEQKRIKEQQTIVDRLLDRLPETVENIRDIPSTPLTRIPKPEPKEKVTLKNTEKNDKTGVEQVIVEIEPKEEVEGEVEENINNNQKEITEFLDENFTKKPNEGKGIEKYVYNDIQIFHNIDKKGVLKTNLNGKIIDHRTDEDYNTDSVKEMLEDMILEKTTADPAEVTAMIHGAGYTEGKTIQDGEEGVLWVYRNPTIHRRFIIHSEIEKSVALMNDENEVIKSFEGEQYTKENLQTIL